MKNYKQKTVESNTHKRDFTPPAISEYMVPRSKLITFQPDTKIFNAIRTLLKHDITGAPVLTESGELVGLIDDKDCLNVLIDAAYYNKPVQGFTVEDYTSNVMKTISEKANIVEAAHEFSRTIYKRLLIVDDSGRLVGQISRRDVLQAINDYSEKLF
jgi:CBS domain-containing protein